MRSTANYKTHPIHAALIPFPLAFLLGSFVFDLVGVLAGSASIWTTGGLLAPVGVVAALVAAVPGFVDWLRTVPPRSSGKTRATKHMLVNLAATALFAATWWLRGGAALEPSIPLLGIEAIGVALLVSGGWMGGTLVYRNQIGVDHRYAGAGKWSRARVRGRGDTAKVAAADELEPSQMKLLDVRGRRIVLARTDEGWFAFDDRCPHRGGSLAGGMMACGLVSCPWHGSQFDVTDGSVREGPADAGIRTYEVREADGDVMLVLPG